MFDFCLGDIVLLSFLLSQDRVFVTIQDYIYVILSMSLLCPMSGNSTSKWRIEKVVRNDIGHV